MLNSAHKTLLAFDYGRKRIGVAVGQTITKSATPLAHLQAENHGMPDWQSVSNLIREWNISDIIVGVPLKMDGTEQAMTRFAREFITQLQLRFKCPVHEVDERLSTKAVREQVFEAGGYSSLKKADIDSLSAQLLLQQWMNQHDNFT